MNKKSKRLRNFLSSSKVGVEKMKLSDAILLLEGYKSSASKFDESVDVCFGMNLDTKQSDQMVRGFVELPHGSGKSIKVLVFCDDSDVKKILDAGAAYAGGDSLITSVESSSIAFDKCVALSDMMPKLAKVAKILGPRGLMPNLKLGTVVPNVDSAAAVIRSLIKGRSDFRADKDGYIKFSIGKLSFSSEMLLDNIKSALDAIKVAKPSGVKGTYFDSLHLSSTMSGFSCSVDLSDIL